MSALMSAVKGESLTVYNPEESPHQFDPRDKVALEGRCCQGAQEDESSYAFQKCDMLCSLQRKLLLGEPLGKDLMTKHFAENIPGGFDGWTVDEFKASLVHVKDILEGLDEGLISPFGCTDSEYQHILVATGIELIRLFVQENFTGPPLSEEVKTRLEEIHNHPKGLQVVATHIEVDHTEVSPSVKAPVLLKVAQSCFSCMRLRPELWPLYLIWRFRIDFLNQRILNHRSSTLGGRLKGYADLYLRWRRVPSHQSGRRWAEVDAAFMIEIAEMLTYYYDGVLAEQFVAEAQRVLEMDVGFSGEMGFRTQFQSDPKTQLVVKMILTGEDSAEKVVKEDMNALLPSLISSLPASLLLGDDTRLERVRLVNESEALPQHSPLHQLVLSAILARNSGNFEDGSELNRGETNALVNVILDNPVAWGTRVVALITRSSYERKDRRAVDRCLRQVEDLLRVVGTGGEGIAASRNYLFFGTGHPLIDEIKVVLGGILESIGHFKEALKIYSDIGLWERVIVCYSALNLRHKAEELIRAKIEEAGETPSLLIHLGDATDDISWYQKAFDLSGGKSFLAQYKLGLHYFARQEFVKAIPHLERGTELAPLEYPCWLKLAWAAYNTENYELAFKCYLRAGNMEYDNFIVWNNLANCATRLKRYDYALRAYKMAVKCNYDEWKVWSNLLGVAVCLEEVNEAVHAYNRVLDLNNRFTDEAALGALVDVMAKAGNPELNLVGSLVTLLARILAKGTTSPLTSMLYAKILAVELSALDASNVEKQRQCYEKSCWSYRTALERLRQNSNWKSDPAVIANTVRCIIEFRELRTGRFSQVMEDSTNMKTYDQILTEISKSSLKDLERLCVENPSHPKLHALQESLREENMDSYYSKVVD